MGQLLCWRHEKAYVVLTPGEGQGGRDRRESERREGTQRGRGAKTVKGSLVKPTVGVSAPVVLMGRPPTPLLYAHLSST